MIKTREELLYELTKHEFNWFVENRDTQIMEYFYQFFAKGGFTNWSDKALQQKYDDSIKEDN